MPVTHNGRPAEGTQYDRRLGMFDGTMLVMGGIIGSGIFLTPAVVAQRVASPGLTVAVWVLGGVIALAGAFCFAELGSLLPRAGGGYVYLREAFGSLPAFLYGWTLLLVISTGAIAAVAFTFASYAATLMGWSEAAVTRVAVVAVIALSGITFVGVRPAASAQNVFTVLKLVALAGLIGVGLVMGTRSSSALDVTSFPALEQPHSLITAVGIALIPVLFSYGGWQQTNFVAEEIIEPERTLPRALVLGVLGVVLVYCLANVVYVRQLGVEGLAKSIAPASDVMTGLFGRAGGVFIGVGITVSTFGFLNLVILVTPRVYQAMASDGVFFQRAARLHPRFRTPSIAIAVQGIWAIALLLSGTYDELLDYVVFGDWIFFGLTGATLFVLRRGARQAATGTFRTPGYPLVPGIFVAAAGYVVVSSILSNPRNAVIGSALIGAGIPVYSFWRRGKTRLD
jgi:basic amino acid/polyamine antiporter, APA family